MKASPNVISRSDHTNILYFNPEPGLGKYVDMMCQRGHDVVITNSSAEALAIMRGQSFDALVIDCAQETVDITAFTSKAHGLQPSLAVFLADEWGDELATGLEELVHVLTMLEDDEFARLKVESLANSVYADSSDWHSSSTDARESSWPGPPMLSRDCLTR